MGNFLVIVNPEALQEEAERAFQSGLSAARALKRQVAGKTVTTPWSLAVTFPRGNGSQTPVFADPQSGSWMLSAGTWFHGSCSDQAGLLQRYLEVGPGHLGLELEGFFTIVVGDYAHREVVVVTDVVGSCHCFMRRLKGGLALSGSSLLLAALQPYTLDPVACQEFVHTGIIYEDRTIYKEVRKLGPASVFRFSEGVLRNQERYWNPETLEPESLAGEMAVRKLWDGVMNAAEK